MKADTNHFHRAPTAAVENLCPAPRRAMQGADLNGKLWVKR